MGFDTLGDNMYSSNPFLDWVISQVQSGEIDVTDEEVQDVVKDIVSYSTCYIDMTLGVGKSKRVRLMVGSPPSKWSTFIPRLKEALGF
jgi:hypothetical protein